MRFVILGGGPAGYAAAGTAAAVGARVTVVEDAGSAATATLMGRDPVEDAAAPASRDGDRRARRAHRRPLRARAARRRPAAHDRPRPLACRAPGAIDPRAPRGSEAEVIYGEASHRPGRRARGTDRGRRCASSSTTGSCIATGASPWEPPFAQVDHERVFTPRAVLDLRGARAPGGGRRRRHGLRVRRVLPVAAASAARCSRPAPRSCPRRTVTWPRSSGGVPAARLEVEFGARANRLENREDGVIVDDRGRPLTSRHARAHLHGHARRRRQVSGSRRSASRRPSAARS